MYAVLIGALVLLVSVWLKLDILAAVAADVPPESPDVLGFVHEKKTPLICVDGVNEIPAALQTVSYRVTSLIYGVGLILYVSVCELEQPF